MKAVMNNERFFILVLMAIWLISCGKDDSPTPVPEPDPELTVYGVISQEPDLSVLTAALDKLPIIRNQLNEEGILGNTGDEFTVFGPENNAFEAFLAENGYDDIESIDTGNATDMDFLRGYVRNHIVLGRIDNSSLENEVTGYMLTHSPESINMFFTVSNTGTLLNGSSRITDMDKLATNGYVHIVDEVIPVPTLATFVESHPDFEGIREALSLIQPGESTVNEDLANAEEYTLFVPEDSAFENFYDEVELENLEDLGPNILKYFVESHAIPGNIVNTQEIEAAIGNTTINTMNIALTVGKENEVLTLTDTQNRVANMVTVDVRASNGILHIIDSVILGLGEPSPEQEPTLYEIISEHPNLTNFTAALEKLPSLRDILNDDSDLITKADTWSLFLPVDDAVDAFLLANGFDGIESIDMENQDHFDFLVSFIYNHVTLETNPREVLEGEGLGFLTTNTQKEIDMFFDATGGNIVLNDAAIVMTDNVARNGIVYVVDNVIPVPNLATFIDAHPNFEIMQEALDIAESEEGSTIKAELSNSSEYTMLVPTDTAFENLYDEINTNFGDNITDISDLGANIVEDIVEIHSIPFTLLDLADIDGQVGGTIVTLTDELQVQREGNIHTLTDPQGRTATLITTDIRASNGYLHVVDLVLLGN